MKQSEEEEEEVTKGSFFSLSLSHSLTSFSEERSPVEPGWARLSPAFSRFCLYNQVPIQVRQKGRRRLQRMDGWMDGCWGRIEFARGSSINTLTRTKPEQSSKRMNISFYTTVDIG